MHVPSWQANWSGAQVTVTHRRLVKPHGIALNRNTLILLKIQFHTFTWTDGFICARNAVLVSITHSMSRDTIATRALKLPR